MNNANRRSPLCAMGLAIAAATMLAFASPHPVAAQEHPDLSGIWTIRRGAHQVQSSDGKPIPFTPKAASSYAYLQGQEDAGRLVPHNPQLGWPKGPVVAPDGPFPFELIQDKHQLHWFFEEDQGYYSVRLGGVHPRNPKPTFWGDAVGSWEGDTMVIDIVGFNGDVGAGGLMPASLQMHVVIRLRLANDGRNLVATYHFDDPGVFLHPWEMVKEYVKLPPGSRLLESVYAENDQDQPDLDD